MYRMPPEKDEQSSKRWRYENSQNSQTYRPRQRRSLQASPHYPKRAVRDFYPDEHPEIPRVRRASLYRSHDTDDAFEQAVASSPSRATSHLEDEYDDFDEIELEEVEDEAEDGVEKVDDIDSVDEEREHPGSVGRGAMTGRRLAAEFNGTSALRRPSRPAVRTGTRNSYAPLTSSRAKLRPPQYSPLPPPSASRRTQRAQRTEYGLPLRSPASAIPASSFWMTLAQQSQRRPVLSICATMLVLLLLFVLFSSLQPHRANVTLGISDAPGRNPASAPPPVVNTPTEDQQGVKVTPINSDRPSPPVFATSAYLLDADSGATIYAHNPLMHLPMMSTTKLMTALLAAEQGKPDETVTINDAIANDISQLSADSSVMGIKKGESYTMRELLYGLLLVSGNDAAVVIGDAVAGGQQQFVDKMNVRAQQLGLHDTHYANPDGLLADNHYSSAQDLALLGKVSLSNSLIHEISNTREYTIGQDEHHTKHVMDNGNQFLWWYPGVDGGKPGWDAGTNYVQVISCVRNNHHLIGVTMHTIDWWTDMRDLMNWGFNTFSWVSPRDSEAAGQSVPFSVAWNHFARDKKELTLATRDGGRYYIYTGYSVSNPVLSYFDSNGGLGSFGYPISQALPLDKNTLSQRFEHATIRCDVDKKVCSKSG